MWGFILRLIARQATTKAMTGIAKASMKQVSNKLKGKLLSKSISKTLQSVGINTLKKIEGENPMLHLVSKILDTKKVMREYQKGEGILKITKNYKALLKGNLVDFLDYKLVSEIRKKNKQSPFSLKKITYKNEYGYVKPKAPKKQYQKKEKPFVDLKQKKFEEKMRAYGKLILAQKINEEVAKVYQYMAKAGYNDINIKRATSFKKDNELVYFENKGSNESFNKKIATLNKNLLKFKDDQLERQRMLYLKSIKYGRFRHNLSVDDFQSAKKMIINQIKNEFYSIEVSQANITNEKYSHMNINAIANTQFRYLRNMDEQTLKNFEIWLNPQEWIRDMGNSGIKRYLEKANYTKTKDTPQSSWISWAVWIPHTPKSTLGFFLVQIKNSKSKRNPSLLYSFGEMWGTPSITKTMFSRIFNSSDVGKAFWKSYFRKYGKRAMREKQRLEKERQKKEREQRNA